MSTFQSRLDDAAGAATCQILNSAGSSLVGWGAVSLVAGGSGLVPLALGSAALLASNYACSWDPDAPSTLPPGDSLIDPGSCLKTDGCGLKLRDKDGAQFGPGLCKELIYAVDDGTYPNGTPKVKYSYVSCDDEQGVVIAYSSKTPFPIYTQLVDGYSCGGDVQPTPNPKVPDYVYKDEGDSDCIINVKFLGMGVEADGTTAPVWQMEPGSDGTKTGGGVIGGCNFEPVIYYQPTPPAGGGGSGGDGGKPPTTVPLPPPGPDGEPPDWLDALKAALAGAAGALTVEALKALLNGPVAGITYEMPAPCDKDEEGNPLVWTGEIPEQDFNPAVLDRLDALSSQLSQHLAWKTPICTPEPPPLEGEFRTISFRSDEVSPFGTNRLRKRLRYRSSSGNDLNAIVDHWKDFVWQSGPIRVRWTGGAWGTVEVWAASEAEGQRVIQHAAGEAGFDPFESGGWSTRTSGSTRLGVSGTMRVDTTGGYFWITARDGSNGRPIVAVPLD